MPRSATAVRRPAEPAPSPTPEAPVERPGFRPQLSVARPYMPACEAVLPYLQRMDDARWYSNFGPLLQAFEAQLAARFARPAAVATVANGTQALTLALRALALPADSLCALPAWTFVASAHAVVAAGLRPWFLDVDPRTWMLDPAAVADALAEAPGEVRAVVPVSAFGRPVDVEAWARFRHQTGIAVVVDAAAAFDSVDRAPVPVVVSLHATKALGIGEGGFVAAPDSGFIDDVRALTTFGFRGGARESETPATNAKLSEYACAVGLASLDAWPFTRLAYRRSAQRLRMALTRNPNIAFQPGWGVSWMSSTCIVGLPEGSADAVSAALQAEGIGTRAWWGRGCHASPAFADTPHAPLPVTERLARSTLGLPFWADMGEAEIERVAAALAEV